jgi:hypothetical protein
MFNDVARGSDTAIVEKFDAPQDETLFSPPGEYIKPGKNWHVSGSARSGTTPRIILRV